MGRRRHKTHKNHLNDRYFYIGKGFIVSHSGKQKLNTKSSTEGELVGTNDASTLILWTKLFMEAQGYEIVENILYQDNKSTILLLENGKRSSSKRTRALNIRYFFLTDQIEKGNLTVQYCPTTTMWSDHLSKPLQGSLETNMRKKIMGHEWIFVTLPCKKCHGNRSVLKMWICHSLKWRKKQTKMTLKQLMQPKQHFYGILMISWTDKIDCELKGQSSQVIRSNTLVRNRISRC